MATVELKNISKIQTFLNNNLFLSSRLRKDFSFRKESGTLLYKDLKYGDSIVTIKEDGDVLYKCIRKDQRNFADYVLIKNLISSRNKKTILDFMARHEEKLLNKIKSECRKNKMNYKTSKKEGLLLSDIVVLPADQFIGKNIVRGVFVVYTISLLCYIQIL
jgi:hypothetical protein